MGVLEILAQAHAVGLQLHVDGDRLIIAGSRAAALPLLDQLRAYKFELMALLAKEDTEVLWRVAILQQHVTRRGPITLPPVRADVPPLVDPSTGIYGSHCGSCGELREPGQKFHCRSCQRARHQVLYEVREGVMPQHLEISERADRRDTDTTM